MGRHRRSADVLATDDAVDEALGRHRSARPKRRVVAPLRTGLLGASAAMAVGAVAVASGLLPGGDLYTVGDGGADGGQIRAEGAPELAQQGGSSAGPTDTVPASESRSGAPTRTPAESASPTPSKPSAIPSQRSKPTAAPARPSRTATPARDTPAPARTTKQAVQTPAAPNTAEAAVLALVNEERAKAGCDPLRSDSGLDSLARDFSDEMAARGFFDHTDPDGRTPWDRADAAGIQGLGGENIARGQATAQAVMDSWMNSEGHRANILNCDYTRLGVGVHTGSGGPWWTQDFGF
ncbi:CAP domain-containing protein [Streptomyces sp. AK02-01A]|uniref:CAP domain-containing protein n=1 Tax=Streptomyces sp. AK02-01A TaxID=3028648 RepID=UPI0029A2F031|nr:CAP domain-containing protein [Streptomyces sp. AK02-01A]MDX3854975.1 CAP domain-containing protein [Streptomyces sp. AK02-01A]